MTRSERQKKLKQLWSIMQINQHGISDGFIGWQGQVVAVLGYNPILQAEFKEAVKSIPESGYHEWRQGGEKAYRNVCSLLSQAINELGIPEDSPIAPSLTNEHDIWWFIHQCTMRSRIKLLLWLIGALVAVVGIAFGVGLKLGMNNWVRKRYVEIMTFTNPTPTASPTNTHPNK